MHGAWLTEELAGRGGCTRVTEAEQAALAEGRRALRELAREVLGDRSEDAADGSM
ncbi:hypothetical protein [Nocardia donostiensis]|uniref:hypothetical protein n=1 Tax=Nocardia donostiensis TaxID=1538463 RepID=UPI00158CEC77|nr:hypothetical protein [Nocardia donostiensis]